MATKLSRIPQFPVDELTATDREKSIDLFRVANVVPHHGMMFDILIVEYTNGKRFTCSLTVGRSVKEAAPILEQMKQCIMQAAA